MPPFCKVQQNGDKHTEVGRDKSVTELYSDYPYKVT